MHTKNMEELSSMVTDTAKNGRKKLKEEGLQMKHLQILH